MVDLSAARQPPALAPSAPVRLLPPAARLALRGSSAVMKVAGAALGLNISDIACRSAQRDGLASLWLGPDEQLLLAPEGDGTKLAHTLQETLAGMRHSVVDISHRQIAVEVTGASAPNILNVGCPLDLHPTQFPVGMCTRTILGKADIVLWRTDRERFHIEVWRSFAAYVTRFLAEAARDPAV